MSPVHTTFYGDWRARRADRAALRDGLDAPPEKLLQGVWFHQRIQRGQLRLLDGRGVRVLHPGFWNREAGPDFRGAMVQFDGEAPRTGDIEVDVCASGWHGHGHDTNPNFQQVILHVVWEKDARSERPTLALKPLLDAPLAELNEWLGREGAGAFPEALAGQCQAPLRTLSPEALTELLRQAALIRLQGKAAQMHARARDTGWEQALWEGLFRALGYKHNVWPMQRLAELRGRVCPENSRLDPLALQARLLGAGGFLPEELPRAQATTDNYVRRLWDNWWREREAFGEEVVPRQLWCFSGLRPANHPQRRLALAAHWLASGDLGARLEHWCVAGVDEARLVPTLLEILQAGRDEFWSWHWTLRAKRMLKPQPLLGAARVTDLAVNVILPWLWVRASEGKNSTLPAELERRYFAWPAAEDNAVLRLARRRLLSSDSARGFQTAASQQGLLQIVKDFCQHSNALCDGCQFPELVGQWAKHA